MITGAQVFIDSIDQTANLTGIVQIDIEEDAARIATFTLIPETGLTDLVGWVGKSVVIKSNIDSTLKTEFTGIIDTPRYNIETGLTTFNCTDNLQEHFETKSKDEIDAIITAYWSEASFNDSEGWEYAQERLSTIPSSLDMDELNNIRVTEWEAKTTEDYLFTDDGYIFESLNSDIASRRNIINVVNLNVEYRYKRLKERQFDYSLTDGVNDDDYVCGITYANHPIPRRTTIQNSITSTGWQLVGDIIYQEVPVGGPFLPCGSYQVAAPLYARGADFTLGKRYSQNVTEKYTITIESADSIAALDEIAINQTALMQTDYDLTVWSASQIADGWGDFGTPSTDINNDNYINQDDDAERQNTIDTAVNIAKTRILSSHRNNNISFVIPYHQDIDTIHTGKILTAKLTAKGKVSNIIKTIDTFTGAASCQVTLRLSKKFGVGVPNTENQPTTPDGLPTEEDTQTADLIPAYHLGGRDSTAYDPSWAGWIADYTVVTEPGHVSYPGELIVNTPAITLNSIDNIEPTDTSLINVTIPDDVLI